MLNILILVATFLLAWFLCLRLLRPTSIFYILDKPTHRSLHVTAKPRVGGIAIILPIFLSWPLVFSIYKIEGQNNFLMLGAVMLAVVSFIDDRYSISRILRLFVHILSALLVLNSGYVTFNIEFYKHLFLLNGFAMNVFTVVLIVWIINLYNFMDGMDGLAGGMGVIGFCSLGWFGWLGNDYLYMMMALIVAASNLGFLIHNFPPAKIFMGDVGSISMGYLMAFFSLWGIRENMFGWWVPLLIFSPFIVDSTYTLIARFIRGEKIWEAHKEHIYQRLVQNGWGHKNTVIAEYILMIAVAVSAIYLSLINNAMLVIVVLSLWVIIYTVIIYIVNNLKVTSRDGL